MTIDLIYLTQSALLGNDMLASKPKNIIATKDISGPFVNKIFSLALEFEINHTQPELSSSIVVANAFFEPSTRTDLSFRAAAMRCGYSCLPFHKNQNHSNTKGETDIDTLITISQYADILVIRHPEEQFIHKAAEIIKKPLINAGNGASEHPTQAMLDIYCICRKHAIPFPLNEDSLSHLHIGLVGDAKYGRTIHSLIILLDHFGAQISIVSPAEFSLPKEYESYVKQSTSIHEVISDLDVLYMTRLQTDRLVDIKAVDYPIIDQKLVHKMKPTSIIMHPLPRVNELHSEVDSDPRAAYFYQMECGMYIRMSLLKTLLENSQS
jgi:aspartate carbamoyltransferase catalytic subunit